MQALTLLAFALLAASVVALWSSRVRSVPAPGGERPRPARVSIIVPARNERANLPRLLGSLSALEHTDFELLVVDGGSRDGSADVVREHARRDARVRLIEEPALPSGWIGKCWACHVGRREASGEWLLFTDADTWHAPESLGRAVAHARSQRADLLTGFSLQELGTSAERTLMPPMFSIIQAAIGGDAHAVVGDPKRAIANGQFMLWRAAAYDAVGGHKAVRGSIVEDLAMARLAASRGLRSVFVDLHALVRVRMYRSVHEMFVGWRKNVATGATHTPPREFAATVTSYAAGLAALPVAAVAWGPASVPAVVAYGLMTWRVRRAQVGSEGAGWRHAFLHPLGYAFFTCVLLASAWDRASGRGPTWKGRRYPVRERAGP